MVKKKGLPEAVTWEQGPEWSDGPAKQELGKEHSRQRELPK